MSEYEFSHVMATLNFIACTLIGWSCVCRMAVMSAETTKVLYRRKYELLFTAATASGFSPILFDEWAGFGQLGMSIAVLVMCWESAREWKDGLPEAARKTMRVLQSHELQHVSGGVDSKKARSK
jgi:hypothetical protein